MVLDGWCWKHYNLLNAYCNASCWLLNQLWQESKANYACSVSVQLQVQNRGVRIGADTLEARHDDYDLYLAAGQISSYINGSDMTTH